VVRRSAFTMIELIFAIVIIAISIMSLPRMAQSTSKGLEGNIVQEAIFAASAELNQAVAANWDENSLNDGVSAMARVIPRVVGTCDAAGHKLGHINQPLHRRCLNAVTAVANTNTNNNVDALNDYAKVGAAMSNAATSQSGYKFAYTTTIAVFHNSLTANSVIFDGAARNDMKKISVTVFNAKTAVTTLNTYSANIGEVDYYKRTY